MTTSRPRDEARARLERALLIVVRKAVFLREAEFEPRVAIAAKIGITSRQLTRILEGRRRLTLELVADVLFATGFELDAITCRTAKEQGQ